MGESKLDDIERLYLENHARMFSYANAILHDPDQAEDAVHDAFVEAMRKYESSFLNHPNKNGWLMLTLKRKIQEKQRAAYKEKKYIISLEGQEFQNNSMDLTQQISMRGFNLQSIQKLISAEDFYLLTRFSLDGLSYTAIAKELGTSPANCAKKMERIRKKLKAHFSDLFEE